MNEPEAALGEGEVSKKVAYYSCALMLAGLISMTLVAIGERTGELDEIRALVTETGNPPALTIDSAAYKTQVSL